MKKSEMVEKLAEYVNGNLIVRDDYERSAHHAKNILALIELYGMLPPKHPRMTMAQVLRQSDLYQWESEAKHLDG